MRRMVEEMRGGTRPHRCGTARARSTPLLQVHDLDFSYGSVQVLFDVDLEVRDGETLAVLGTNGAGKSTLLRVISGLGLPDRGAVRLIGETITYLPAEARSKKGIVQVRGGDVFAGLSVQRQPACRARRASGRASRRRVAASPTCTRSSPRSRPAATRTRDRSRAASSRCSRSGARSCSSRACSSSTNCRSGWRRSSCSRCLHVVERLQEEGYTMVVVEQSLNIAAAISDRVVFIEKGRIRFDGPTQRARGARRPRPRGVPRR